MTVSLREIAPLRAPSRAAFASMVFSWIIRPKSTTPNTSNSMIGSTSANSTAAAPLWFLRRLT